MNKYIKRIINLLLNRKGEVEPDPDPPVEPVDWQSTALSEETRNNEDNKADLAKYKTGDDMYKSLREAQSSLSKKGVIVPGENATDEEKSAFKTAMGRPETAEGYKITQPEGLHESIKPTPESQKSFLDAFHKMGISQDDANNINDWFMKEQSARLVQADKERQTASETAESALKQEWGDQYEANTAAAQKAFDIFGKDLDPESMKDPAVKKTFQMIGSKISEDVMKGLVDSNKGGEPNPDAAKEIQAINADPKHPHNDENHKEHNDWVGTEGKMAKLFAKSTTTVQT